ncbi:hypothetical protein JM93_01595 [Roseibium hamelinense]|uniref:VOC domain-containing protein n=1 Tax=Roseibium hamelinense TaxID=150831 RepID=A0A562T7E3_9HYPH|nr:VOC family protein [Roseibium hamelinense]MTI43710.1 VOC family protein [Roseibium hamelinense]TWI89392.1 hypothetical protein JM93_01595 [Roseibium hamelinense]
MTFIPKDFNVWMELPVTDFDKAVFFYNTVFKTELKVDREMGPNPIALFPTQESNGVGGHLYPGTPPAKGSGPTIHLACPDSLEETAERLKAAGGEVVTDAISIPAGRFMYCLDPDGNSISLFSS